MYGIGGRADVAFLKQKAQDALKGVGDASLGEWDAVELGGYTLRRRLSAKEQRKIGNAKDIRGTPEAEKRVRATERYHPAHLKGWIE